MCVALLRRGMEELFDQAELPAAADKGRLEARGPQRPASEAHDADGAVQVHALGLALELVRPGALVHDGRVGGPPGGVLHVHRPGRGQRLYPRGCVHDVPGDHPLPFGPNRHRGLAGHYARPDAKLRHAHVLPERGDGLREIERRPDGSLGIVLLGGGGAPDRHDGVPDEFLNRSTVAGDQSTASVKVAGKELPDLLRIARLRQPGEPDQVCEQHRNEAALGSARVQGGGLCGCSGGSPNRARGPAFIAELGLRGDRGPAGGTNSHERRTAL